MVKHEPNSSVESEDGVRGAEKFEREAERSVIERKRKIKNMNNGFANQQSD